MQKRQFHSVLNLAKTLVDRTLCNDMVFFLNFAPLTSPATFLYHRNDYLIGGVAVKLLLSK